MESLSRRRFLLDLAGSVATVSALSPARALAAGSGGPTRRIFLPPGSPLPLETAAAELAEHTKGEIVRQAHRGAVEAGDLVIVPATEVRSYPEAAAKLANLAPEREWELVQTSGGGLVFSGSTPRNLCRAALGWIADPERETDRLSVYQFGNRFTRWDNSMNQKYRFSVGFDLARHVREVARLGHTGIEINRYADIGGYHVLHRKFPHDSYAWFMSYAPALDAFVESSLTQGLYAPEELAANLADLRANAALARRYGLTPGFVCYEPRGVNEEIFDRYPELRGSRIDHPGRSLQPRYNLDIANPRVLRHYAEMMTKLMEAVPDMGYFVFYTQDSGSGIPFATMLYAGPNGSYLARSKTIEKLTADFTRTLSEAGRKVNPDLQVIMEFTSVYTDAEARKIRAKLPKGVSTSYPLAGSLTITGRTPGPIEGHVAADRAVGIEPSANVIIAAGWDAEPIIGVPAPTLLARKFAHLRHLKMRNIFTNGGIFSPPQCPYEINQELYTELIREEALDVDAFLLRTARHWCDGDSQAAALLVQAWKMGDEGMNLLPDLHGYVTGSSRTQARWLVRPLVPDISLLSPEERIAWERVLFPMPWDPARLNIVFDGGIRIHNDAQLDEAVRAFDGGADAKFARTVEILDQAMQLGAKPVIEDQRDRYRGYLHCLRSDRNLYAAQAAINHYLLKQGVREAHREALRDATRREIANTRDWIRVLRETKTNFFHLSAREETPYFYKTPLEDFTLKLKAMEAHLDDEPGPYLPELEDLQRPRLQFS